MPPRLGERRPRSFRRRRRIFLRTLRFRRSSDGLTSPKTLDAISDSVSSSSFSVSTSDPFFLLRGEGLSLFRPRRTLGLLDRPRRLRDGLLLFFGDFDLPRLPRRPLSGDAEARRDGLLLLLWLPRPRLLFPRLPASRLFYSLSSLRLALRSLRNLFSSALRAASFSASIRSRSIRAMWSSSRFFA